MLLKARSLKSVAISPCRRSGCANSKNGQTSCVSRFASGPAGSTRTPAADHLVVQDDAEKRRVDLDISVVLNESKVSELVHEEVDARTRRPDHLRKRFLRDLRYPSLRSRLIAVPREQQQHPRQPLFTGVEEMIDEVRFDADV